MRFFRFINVFATSPESHPPWLYFIHILGTKCTDFAPPLWTFGGIYSAENEEGGATAAGKQHEEKYVLQSPKESYNKKPGSCPAQFGCR